MQSSGSALAAIGVFVLLAACGGASSPQASVAFEAPVDFAAERLDGGSFRLSELRGKVVLLDIWASWCSPCRQAFPFYAELHAEARERGLVVVAVNVDEDEDAARRFLDATPAPFVVVRDPAGEVPSRLNASAMPTSYLIDREGFVRYRHEGFTRGDAGMIRRRVNELLGRP